MDSMLEKSKELDKKIQEERDKIDPNRDGWADQTLHDKLKEHDSTLKGKDKDDFFERASRYADGDYSMGKPTVSKSKMRRIATKQKAVKSLAPTSQRKRMISMTPSLIMIRKSQTIDTWEFLLFREKSMFAPLNSIPDGNPSQRRRKR
jgi:hypothetical protein